MTSLPMELEMREEKTPAVPNASASDSATSKSGMSLLRVLESFILLRQVQTIQNVSIVMLVADSELRSMACR